MASLIDNLTAAKNAYAAELALGNVKPSYSINGQSVSWNEYRASLIQSIRDISQLIADEGGPVEVITEGIP